MNEEEFFEFINKGPNQSIEFVRGIPASDADKKELSKLIAAFSNTNDGVILVGVDKNTKRLMGIDQGYDFTRGIREIGEKHCVPQVNPKADTRKIGQREIGVIEVKRGTGGPYYADGECYIRKGGEIHIASHGDVQSMYQKKYPSRKEMGDDWAVDGAVYEELDSKKLDMYIKKRTEILGEKTESASKKFLKDIRILAESNGKLIPTAGALLMFGKNPQYFLSSSSVRVARFKGKDIGSIIIDQKEIRGTIPEMIEASFKFIATHMSTTGKIEGIERSDITEYPIVAVREAITNAIIHRDYSVENSHTRIFMFDDRIEVYTPGGLPPLVTIENIDCTQYSRNKVITDALLYTGQYIEKLGTGIRRIKLTLRERGLREPRFLDSGVDFILTLYGPIDRSAQSQRQEKVMKAQELIGPAKSPQEIGRLTIAKKEQVSRYIGKSHLSRGVQKISMKDKMAKKKASKAVTVIIIVGIFLWIFLSQASMRNNPAIMYKKAAVLHAGREFYKAATVYAEFIKKFPHDEKVDDALYYMAACLELANDNIKALNAYSELIEKYPNSFWIAQAYYSRAAIYSRLDQFDDSIKEYQRILEAFPNSPISVSTMNDMALIFQKQKKFEEAIDLYERILESKNFLSDGQEHYQMGICYLGLGLEEKAKEMFEKVISNEKADQKLIQEAKDKLMR